MRRAATTRLRSKQNRRRWTKLRAWDGIWHHCDSAAYGSDLADRLRKARIDALIDTHGGGYVKLAVELGVSRDRIDTITDFAAARE